MKKDWKAASGPSLFVDKFCGYGILFYAGIPTSRAVATPVKGGDAMEMAYYIIMLFILLEILRTIKK